MGTSALQLFATPQRGILSPDEPSEDAEGEEEWVVPEHYPGAVIERKPIEASPYDSEDIHSSLPCDLIESWISAHKLPMMTYRPSKSCRNPKQAIDMISIHLKKNFHIFPYIFQLRGTGEELLSLAEAINEVRTITLREMNLIGCLD